MTLCISAVFAVSRCPSVCLSVKLVDCIQTAEDIVRLLCRLSSPIILVFWLRAPVPNFKGNFFSRVQNTRVEKSSNFWLKSLSIWETVRDRPIVAMGTLIGTHMFSIIWWLKSDTVAVFTVIPRRPRYYRRNGIKIQGSTAVIGLELTVFPR